MIQFLKVNMEPITNNIHVLIQSEKKKSINRHTQVMKMSLKGYKLIVKKKMQVQNSLLPDTPGIKTIISGAWWSKAALFQTLHVTHKKGWL